MSATPPDAARLSGQRLESDPVSVCPTSLELGEGPIWVDREQALYFVDIVGHRIHRWRNGELSTWTAPAEPGFIVPDSAGGFVVGLRGGLHRFSPDDGKFHLLAAVETDQPRHRLNDGFVDTAGRLWFGTMHEDAQTLGGKLYLYDGSLTVRDEGYVVTNGPAASPDGRTLYHTDSDRRTVYQFDHDGHGNLRNKRIFVKLPEGVYPDGMAVDSAGNVWIALFNGWRVEVYSPHAQKLLEVPLPCTNVTKVAFGGTDQRTLFITTARLGVDSDSLAQQPQAGNLFSARVRLPGLRTNEARL